MPCYGATMDDIDSEAIKYFLMKGIKENRMSPDVANTKPEEVISNLGLIENGIPSYGAILLFGKNPQRWFVTSSFKIGRFGNTNFDLLSQEIIDGNIIQMPERVLRTLDEKYLIRPIHYDGLQRVEPLEIPVEALREIICNSIVHRDYQGTWTQMSIYNDHIRLWNEGGLPDDLSIEKLMGKHTSKPRNPKMAEAFYHAGFIEAWGSGIEKIVNGFQAEGLTPPRFSVEQGGVTVIIPREKFQAVNLGNVTEFNQFNQSTCSEKSSEKSSEKGSEKGSENNRDRIVREMKENPGVTINELASMLSISDRAVSKHIKKLQEAGIVKRVGADRGGSWEVVN